MKSITISKPDRIIRGRVSLPASKSISNRVLIIRAMSGHDFPVENLSEAADTRLLVVLLEQIRTTRQNNNPIELDTGNSGTAMRFLTAYLSMKPGTWHLTGSERMQQRPLGPLVEALRELGASIEYLSRPDYPPVLIKGRSLRGGVVNVDAGVSSQFVSALLLIAPALPGGLKVMLKGNEVSAPYTTLTCQLLRSFGIRLRRGNRSILVRPGPVLPHPFSVEADWTAASFWYEAVALAESADLELPRLCRKSFQGDSILPEIFSNFGVETAFTGEGIRLTRIRRRVQGFYYDFTRHPDLAQPVIATCAALGLRARFEGMGNLRIKECDRLEAMKKELSRLGAQMTSPEPLMAEAAFDLIPSKLAAAGNPVIDTYGDHRMAMAFAPLSMITGPLQITEPEIVEKSYPSFWKEMKEVGFLM